MPADSSGTAVGDDARLSPLHDGDSSASGMAPLPPPSPTSSGDGQDSPHLGETSMESAKSGKTRQCFLMLALQLFSYFTLCLQNNLFAWNAYLPTVSCTHCVCSLAVVSVIISDIACLRTARREFTGSLEFVTIVFNVL